MTDIITQVNNALSSADKIRAMGTIVTEAIRIGSVEVLTALGFKLEDDGTMKFPHTQLFKKQTTEEQTKMTLGAAALLMPILEPLSPRSRTVAVRDIIDLAFADANVTVSCAKGCSNCCHQDVVVSSDEAVALHNRGGANKIRMDLHRRSAPSNLSFALAACPYLDTASGECRVYEERPIMCRKVWSQSSPETCKPGGESQILFVTLADAATIAWWFLTERIGLMADMVEGVT